MHLSATAEGNIYSLPHLLQPIITKEMNDAPGLYSVLVALSLRIFQKKICKFCEYWTSKRRRSIVVKYGSENNKTNIFNQTMN